MDLGLQGCGRIEDPKGLGALGVQALGFGGRFGDLRLRVVSCL